MTVKVTEEDGTYCRPEGTPVSHDHPPRSTAASTVAVERLRRRGEDASVGE